MLLKSNLHPHQANADHDTGSKDDKSTEEVTSCGTVVSLDEAIVISSCTEFLSLL